MEVVLQDSSALKMLMGRYVGDGRALLVKGSPCWFGNYSAPAYA